MTSTVPHTSAPLPSAAPRGRKVWLAVTAVIVALLVGGVIGWAVWGGSNQGPTTFKGSYGTVQIQDSYPAKITFVNGNDGVALQRLNGGRPLATVYAVIPGTIKPKVGEVVNAVIMTVLNPNGSGYQMATLWPKKTPQ